MTILSFAVKVVNVSTFSTPSFFKYSFKDKRHFFNVTPSSHLNEKDLVDSSPSIKTNDIKFFLSSFILFKILCPVESLIVVDA